MGKRAGPEGLCPCFGHLDGLTQMGSIRPVPETGVRTGKFTGISRPETLCSGFVASGSSCF